MSAQDSEVIVFDNLISHSEMLRGGVEQIKITAKAFTQVNANGELKSFDTLEGISSVARTSGEKIVAAFSA